MPNILITGTPGTGKSTLAHTLATMTNHQHLDVSRLVKEKEFHDGHIPEFDTLDLNEDKLIDYLEDEVLIHTARNCIVDFHTPEIFPERWFDLVVVLRTDNAILVPRLASRYVSMDSKRGHLFTCFSGHPTAPLYLLESSFYTLNAFSVRLAHFTAYRKLPFPCSPLSSL